MRPWHQRPRTRRRDFSYEVKNGVTQAKLLERHVVREIVDRLWLQARIKVWVINQPVAGKTPQNVAGIPDLIGFIPKHGLGVNTEGLVQPVFATSLFIECKRPGGVRSPAQERFIQEAQSSGCCAFFAESWADVVRELSVWGIKLEEIE